MSETIGIKEKIHDFTDFIVASKLDYARARIRNPQKQKTLLCYPEKPQFFHMLYAVYHKLGWRVITDPTQHFDIAMAFHDAVGETTVRKPDPTLERLRKDHKVINGYCDDVSKTRVDEVFREVFGYGTLLDPRTHRGACVEKSNANALHDGRVITCPAEPKQGFVYQKLINNQRDADSVMDIRLPIFGAIIPFSSRRYRSIHDRFDNTWETHMTRLQDDLTQEEIQKVLAFCKKFNFDYGDIDLLRDNDDGRLYIVDVNTSPAGPRPGVHMSHAEYDAFVAGLTRGFEEAFLKTT